jgi:hypothetical protein
MLLLLLLLLLLTMTTTLPGCEMTLIAGEAAAGTPKDFESNRARGASGA